MFKNDSKRSLNYYQVFDHYLKALLDKVWVKLMIIYSHDDWGTINALHTSLLKKRQGKVYPIDWLEKLTTIKNGSKLSFLRLFGGVGYRD